MGDYTPVNTDNAEITLTAGAVLTGGLLVTSSGVDDTVVHTTSSTAGRRPIGVAAQDAPSGGRVGVYLLPGYLHSIPAEAGVTPVDGDWVVATSSPGRITSTSFSWSTTIGSVPGPHVIGMVVRATTGTTGTGGTTRFLGF